MNNRTAPGFVLLMTLVLIALAGVALASVGRQSAQQALRAMDLEADLQRQWLIRSTEQVLLPQAETVLSQQKHPGELDVQVRATAVVSFDVQDYAVEITFADEQAKLNPNALLERQSVQQLEPRIQQSLTDLPAVHRPKLAPVTEVERRLNRLPEDWPGFAGFSQVLPQIGPQQLLPATGTGPAHRITFWGDGRVNVLRAEAAVLAAVLHPEIAPDGLQRLLALRQGDPDASLDLLLDQLSLENETRARVEQRLTDTSATHSVWIRLRDPQRTWDALIVRTGSQASQQPSVPDQIYRLIW